MGLSRSASCVLAYLMEKHDMSLRMVSQAVSYELTNSLALKRINHNHNEDKVHATQV